MARLPSKRFLVQQIGGDVVLFEDGTESEIVRATAADGNDMAKAQRAIYNSVLSDEDKCFAHFWFGYFYASHSSHAPQLRVIGDMRI